MAAGIRAQHLHRVRSARRRVGGHGRQDACLAVGVTQQVVEDSHRIATQRAAVTPPFAETEFQVAYGGPVDFQLRVVPGRPRAIDRGHGLMLPVAGVLFLIPPAVTQIDASDEGNV